MSWAGGTSDPVGDESYSIWPTLAFDKITSRGHYVFSCSPGFTLYQHMSSLNQANQGATIDMQHRLSPTSISVCGNHFKEPLIYSTNPILFQPQ